MSITYSEAWLAYFRADQAVDDAIADYYAARREDPNSIATARAYDAAIAAMRKAFAAEDLAEAITEGADSEEIEQAISDLSFKAAEAKREAEREVRRRAGLKGGVR
jgi:fatty acid-binding protein DegV